ncbi:ASPIC/UnbV domain-containing protein [Candidatus Entotheonella palauensis]|uniref:ASPIC/UnbV domain-containing protein n=1 Tax=Candidatus Entotheonella palauensis TaxID=93172 RepID=UPI0015C425DA|nr:ASPIC/UnbV domain-containing protein [Candidatus Entotheonella palauensis]
MADLNNDRWPNVVSVSNFDVPQSTPSLYPNLTAWGGPFDNIALAMDVLVPTGNPDEWVLNDDMFSFPNGTLSVELNNGGNGNHGVEVKLMGTIGPLADGKLNRDGVGSVVTFTPKNGPPTLRPVTAGSSYASQNSLALTFGLGKQEQRRCAVAGRYQKSL